MPFIPAFTNKIPSEFVGIDWNLSTELTGTTYWYMNKYMYLVLIIYAVGMPNLCTILIDSFAKMRGENPNSILFNIIQNTFDKKFKHSKEKKENN